jgi:ABC-type branched-subunit amino acid transport system ATPase component
VRHRPGAHGRADAAHAGRAEPGPLAAGITILLVEQTLRKALEIAQRGTVIETGRVRLEGTSAELAANPEIRAAYLGI